jgi:hypothetical protein
MAKPYANIQPGFDTWAAVITKLNNLLDDSTNIVVTTASNSSGAVVTGNAYVNGTLSSAIGAFNSIQGGNVSTSGTLTITSNAAVANGFTLSFGNTSVNTTINATSFSGIANTALALDTSRNIALSSDVTGNANFNGTANITITATLANTGVTANTYGNTSAYPVVTVDSKGRVTSVTTQTVSTPAAGVTSFNTRTGDVLLTASDITGNSTVGLNYTPVSANTSGSISGSLTLTGAGDFTGRDFLSSRDIRAGNSTVNAVVNAISITLGNSTIYTAITSTTVNTGSVLLGNNTVNAVVNSSALTIGNTTISSSATSLYTPTIRGARDVVSANTSASGDMVLDLSYGIHRWTVTGNVTSINYSNVPANNIVYSGTLYVTANNGGTNSTNRSITFPSAANATTGKTLWSGALVPPQTSSNGSVDIYQFFTIDGGNNYVWSLAVKDAR